MIHLDSRVRVEDNKTYTQRRHSGKTRERILNFEDTACVIPRSSLYSYREIFVIFSKLVCYRRRVPSTGCCICMRRMGMTTATPRRAGEGERIAMIADCHQKAPRCERASTTNACNIFPPKERFRRACE